MKLATRPPKDGLLNKYDCGLELYGSWASRIEQYERFCKSDLGKYILKLEAESECAAQQSEPNENRQVVELIKCALVSVSDGEIRVAVINSGFPGKFIVVTEDFQGTLEVDRLSSQQVNERLRLGIETILK